MIVFSIERCIAISLASLLSGSAIAAEAGADNFTAKAVMEKMTAEERYPYLAGVVEGLAYARFVKDGQQTSGMKCIYDWFYGKPDTQDLIYAGMGRYPDYTPGAIVGALADQTCGG